jgi:hypothetical protein
MISPRMNSGMGPGLLCYELRMRTLLPRSVFTVMRNREVWAVEHHGEYFDHSSDKSEVKASANKRARQAQDAGLPCQVRITGESSFV